MKTAETQLPDQLYDRLEGLAQQLSMSVPEVLRQAVEQMVDSQSLSCQERRGEWRFPEGRSLGAFVVPSEEWRLLANGGGDVT